VGESSDPHLGGMEVDAVLIANTYHELDDPKSILSQICPALRPGGRLVVVDRGPATSENDEGGESADRHEIPALKVANELGSGGFSVMSLDIDFIDRPGDHWWMITAQKNQCQPTDKAV
ncbi:MAG TPA: methyltransferase domain-containing protein, partial [Terriglobia bacterium]|nr:methyltransferase domain-containing protein [Terriglobia bacterium]